MRTAAERKAEAARHQQLTEQAVTMFTRNQYMKKECTHSEYYAQFVTKGMKKMVESRFTLERLKRSKDGHFNDVTQLREWDVLNDLTRSMLDKALWKSLECPYTENGYLWSMNNNICILKEAARQLVEEAKETA